MRLVAMSVLQYNVSVYSLWQFSKRDIAFAGLAFAGVFGICGLLKRRKRIQQKEREAFAEKVCAMVLSEAKKGDPESVLATFDRIGSTMWMMNVGDNKGGEVDKVLRKFRPRFAVELGGYLGYSAVRIARLLPEGGRFVSIEVNPAFAAVARRIVEHAGLFHKVTIEVGEAASVLPTIKAKHGVDRIDFLFIDHWKDLYLPDFKLAEKLQLLKSGSVVVADNIIFPGAPEYRAYVEALPDYDSQFIMSKLEYSDREDALLVSIKK